MANLHICHHNQFGHCKFRETCKYQHVNGKCEINGCKIINCLLRHPRKCKFFVDYRRCKFGEYCSYEHDLGIADNSIEAVKEELEEVKLKLKALEKHLETKDNEIKETLEKMNSDTHALVEKQLNETLMMAIHQATVSALQPLSARQDEFENRTFSRLDSFINLVSTLAEHAEKPHETTENTLAGKPLNQKESEPNLTAAQTSFPQTWNNVQACKQCLCKFSVFGVKF